VNLSSTVALRFRGIERIVHPMLLRVILLSLAASLPCHAVVVADLYNVKISVTDQNAKARNAAFDDGLAEVLIRVSGNHAVLEKLRIPAASAYVQQYFYRELDDAAGDDTAGAGGAGDHAAGYLLQIQYNPAKIVELLRANAQPVWSEHRNEVVCWIAVRDGANRYLLRRNDQSALKVSVEAAASRRGLPIVWPVYDKQDQQQLTFADAWAAFERPLKTTSARYSDGPVIVGRLGWNGSQWTGEWTVYVEQSTRSWVSTNADYDALVSLAMDLISDEIGSHYAVQDVHAGELSPDLLIEIENVDSVSSYRRLSRYLGRLTAVKDVRVVSMDAGDHVVFAVSLRSRPEDFEKLVAIDHLLHRLSVTEPITQPGIESPVMLQPRLHYRYQP
jgi:uncharacterized protein